MTLQHCAASGIRVFFIVASLCVSCLSSTSLVDGVETSSVCCINYKTWCRIIQLGCKRVWTHCTENKKVITIQYNYEIGLRIKERVMVWDKGIKYIIYYFSKGNFSKMISSKVHVSRNLAWMEPLITDKSLSLNFFFKGKWVLICLIIYLW